MKSSTRRVAFGSSSNRSDSTTFFKLIVIGRGLAARTCDLLRVVGGNFLRTSRFNSSADKALSLNKLFNFCSFTCTTLDIVCGFSMWYVIAILVFFLSLLLLVFAKDSYINRELDAYQKTINEPWIDPVVALTYKWN